MKSIERRTFFKALGAIAAAPVFGKIELAEAFLIPPEIDLDKVLMSFYEASTVCGISTTQFEGKIKHIGDSVIVRRLPKIEVMSYTRGQKMPSLEATPERIKLKIDRGEKFNLKDDIKNKALASEAVGIELSHRVDSDVFTKILQSVPSSNRGNHAGEYSFSLRLGTKSRSVVTDKNNILDAIVDMGTALDENNIPRDFGRWAVLPSCMLTNIRMGDLKIAHIDGNFKNGKVGVINDMSLYCSNNIPVVQTGRKPVWCVPFGHKNGFAFACNVEERRLVYGSRAIEENALGVYHARV